MSRRIRPSAVVAVLGIAVALGISGCGQSSAQPQETGQVSTHDLNDQSSPESPDHTKVFWQQLPEGGKVLCVWAMYNGYHQGSGGLSCDWAGTRPSDAATP